MIKSMAITVSGKVQGVFYRQSTLEKARELGLRGWVKNCANGDVFIRAEGEEDQLRQLVDWCREGPRLAVVQQVECSEAEPVGVAGFRIER